MSLSKWTPLLFFALVLAAAPAAAAVGDAAPAPVPAPADAAPLGDCGPAAPVDIAALVEPVEAPVCSADAPAAGAGFLVEPVEQQGPPKRGGFCRCGCGITCETDADCGGGSCDPFVTCC